jgi:RNA polymerase sigma-70 factor (ECF subfamily)
MRSALGGDSVAYRAFLHDITPHLRALARSKCARYAASNEIEDVVQETLLAVHLKRGTWDPERAIRPWLATILRNKLVDILRRRGRRVDIPIEEFSETLAAEADSDPTERSDVERLIDRLGARQGDIVRSISIQGAGIRETAQRLGMTEVAVRVSLHRALKALAALYRQDAGDGK